MDIAEDGAIDLYDQNGSMIHAEILFTFQTDAGNHYMVLTDHSENEDGMPRAFPMRYIPNDPEGRLMPVADEEWDEVATIYQMIFDEIRANAEGEETEDGEAEL